jgi:hypothetical protein
MWIIHNGGSSRSRAAEDRRKMGSKREIPNNM